MCHVLYGKPDNPDVELLKWEWHTDYGLTDDQFHIAVNAVHRRQQDFKPFKGAVEALQNWRKRGLYITIATHRRVISWNFEALVRWLDAYNIPYDAIYMGLQGKEALFGPTAIVIDDRPSTIEAAVRANCHLAVTLAHPYVKETVADFAPYARMGETWDDIKRIVDKSIEVENRRDGLL
jgi:beta-phosphoglucomutase-like phosphatase (HAD superfamily)